MITQTHHAQNPLNIELLNYVIQQGSATWQELFDKFSDKSDSLKSLKRFSKKIAYLVFKEYLQYTGRGSERVYTPGSMAGQKHPTRGRVTAKKGQVTGSDAEHPYPHLKDLCGLVPPRQYISTDSYKVPPNNVLRPGALDYKNHASHGDRC